MTTEAEQLSLLRSLKNTLDGQSDDLAAFKRAQAERLDKLETRLSRPGALVPGAMPKRDAEPVLVDAETGRPLLELRAGDDFEALYRAAGRLEDSEFRDLTLTDWMRAVAGQKSTELARKSLAVGNDAAGGHLVPAVLMPAVLNALVPASALLQAGTRIVSMEGTGDGAKTFTLAAVNAIPTAAWRAENGAISESAPTFRAVVATPRSLAFFFRVSRELLADSVNLDRVIAAVIAQSMARELDRAGLIGSGTAPEPRGLRNTAGVQTVANGAAGASLTTAIRWTNILTAHQAILQADGPMPNACIMSPRSLVTLSSISDTLGQPLQRPPMLEPLRTLSSSQIPNNLVVGASSDCSEMFLGDFRRTFYVMREQVSIRRLDETFATTGQVGFVSHVRADFCVEYPAAFAHITGIRP